MASVPHGICEPDRAGLRSFGLTTGAMVAVLFGLVFPWLLEHAVPLWPWAVGGLLVLWALMAPASLRPVYRGWMRFGLIMSRVTTPLILGLVFYVLITPVALVRGLMRKDSLARKLDGSLASYRVKSRAPGRTNLERPF